MKPHPVELLTKHAHGVMLAVIGIVIPTATLAANASVLDVNTFCTQVCSSYRSSVETDGTVSPTSIFQLAQSFTVANTGTLTGFDLYGGEGNGGTITSYIVPLQNGIPITDLSASLAQASVALPGGAGEAANSLIGFSGLSVPVTSGEELGIVLTADLKPGAVTGVLFDFSDAHYSRGSAFARSNLNIGVPPMTWSPFGLSMMFRTYVSCSTSRCRSAPPAAAPELDPYDAIAALTLLAGGVAVMRGGRLPVKRPRAQLDC